MTETGLRIWLLEPGGRGGVYHYTLRLARALGEIGVSAQIWTAEDAETPPSGWPCALRPWMRWHRARGAGGRLLHAARLHRALNLWTFAKARARYRRALEEERPDLVHVQGGFVPALTRGLLCDARRTGIAAVLTPHNAFPRSRRLGARRAFRRMLESADRLVLLADSDPAALASLGGAMPPWKVIPFGPLDLFETSPGAGKRVREALGIPREAFVVLAFGYLRPDKGRSVLLDAIAALENERAWLLVAGDPGGEGSALRGEIARRGLEPRVRTDLRYIPNEEAGAFFEAADVVALPYEVASESGVLRTAIALERPVVAAAAGGLACAIEEGRTGFRAEAGGEGFADAIRRAIGAGEAGRRAVAKEASKRALERAGWPAIAEATRQFYDEVLMERGR